MVLIFPRYPWEVGVEIDNRPVSYLVLDLRQNTRIIERIHSADWRMRRLVQVFLTSMCWFVLFCFAWYNDNVDHFYFYISHLVPIHVVQVWAIPPPSWGLLSRWHRQQTTTPETNEASSSHSLDIRQTDILQKLHFIWLQMTLAFFMTNVTKLNYTSCLTMHQRIASRYWDAQFQSKF